MATQPRGSASGMRTLSFSESLAVLCYFLCDAMATSSIQQLGINDSESAVSQQLIADS